MSGQERVKQCQLCSLQTSSMSFLLRHLTEVHSNRPGFHLTCGLNNCQRTYHNITTYKHHVYAMHGPLSTNIMSIPDPIQDLNDDLGPAMEDEAPSPEQQPEENDPRKCLMLPQLFVTNVYDNIRYKVKRSCCNMDLED